MLMNHLLNLESSLYLLTFRNIKKYRKIIRRRTHISQVNRSRNNTPPVLSDFDIYIETGMIEDEFERLYQNLKNHLRMDRRAARRNAKHRLSPRVRLLMVLHYLREHPKYRILSQKFNISPTLSHREVRYLLPKIYVSLQGEIRWPDQLYLGWEGVSGAVDCTHHPRTRVHPFQADYYRRDKGFMLLSQVVCGLEGRLYQVDLLTGHNNDSGAFNITGLKSFLIQNQIRLLADSGYSHHLLETPNDLQPKSTNMYQKGLRSIVEAVIGLVKNWRITSTVFRGSPEFQTVAVLTCFQLTAMRLNHSPLREISNDTPLIDIN
jgi:hypothetical protein